MDSIYRAFADPVLKALPRIPQAILTILLGVVIIYLVRWFIEYALKLTRTPRSLHDIILSVTSIALWAILAAAAFQSVGLNQIALTISGSVAIIGIAIGTGSNLLIQDIIAGLFLTRDKDFDVGYWVKINDLEGVIKRIDLRKIRLEDKEGKIHVLPSGTFDKGIWTVLGRDGFPAPETAKKK